MADGATRGKTVSAAGVIEAVFAHRFILRREDGTRLLADLGPKGAEAFTLREGDAVTVEGEAKPSEIKVSSIARRGGEPVAIAHGKQGHGKPGHDKPEHGGEAAADPSLARAAAEKAGYAVVGQPRRKPKHFEVLGEKDGRHVELHVELDGTIRKEKPGDGKWAPAAKSAA